MKNIFTAVLTTVTLTVSAQSDATLSETERLYGLSKLWSEAKYNFVNFDLVKVNWDSLYQSYIPHVLQAGDTRAYYDLLMAMYAQLEDGHTDVCYPLAVAANIGHPPIRTQLIEGKVIVTGILNDSVRLQNNVAIGDEIVEIDKVNAVEYGVKQVMPYISASTEQDRINRTYNQELFRGDINKMVRLKIARKTGKPFETTVSRSMSVVNIAAPYEFKTVNKNIGYLRIGSFAVDDYRTVFDSIYPALLKTAGLVIDLRDNGGGNTEQSNYVLSHLTERPFMGARWKTRQYLPTLKARGYSSSWLSFDAEETSPANGKTVYKAPVVVLISERTFSAAEDFLVAFDGMKRGVKIGQTTGGSTCQPITFTLPGGGSARVSTKRATYPDGKEFVGTGIAPDIVVKETINNVRKGKDAVLERALLQLAKR